MATVEQDIAGLEAALAAMGERAASDPDYREKLIADHVSALAAAGVSALSLTESLIEADATSADVQAFGMNPLSFASVRGGVEPDEPQHLILSHSCIGTCTGPTLWACGGCTKSFKANP
jgi:hypothetical protein